MIFRSKASHLSVFSLILLCLALGGCTKAPEQEMSDAKASIENAKAIKADLYAFEGYKKAIDAHSNALQAFEARKYREARKFAILTKEEADASVQIAMKNMELFKERARKSIDALETTLSAVHRILENRKEEIANEITELETGFDLVRSAYESGDFKKAEEKAGNLTEKANKILERFDYSRG